MPVKFNVNSDDFVKLTARLERLNKKAFPSTVRTTLNSLAFKSKQELPSTMKKKGYEERNKNFTKFISRFERVKGSNVKAMSSRFGVADVTRGVAAKNMEQQEKGGSIDKKYIPLTTARTGKKNSKSVAARNRMSKLGVIPKQGSRFRINRKDPSKFVKRSAELIKKGQDILVYDKLVYRILSFKRGRKKPVKAQFLYRENEKGTVKIKGKHSVNDTGVIIGRTAAKEYAKAARKFLK